MDHNELVASIDADAERYMQDAIAPNNAGEQKATEPAEGSPKQEESVQTVSTEVEQPVVAATDPAEVSSPEVDQIYGLTLENAKQKLKNADSATRGAQRRMTEATQEASALRKENAELKVLLGATRGASEGLRKQVEELTAAAHEPSQTDTSDTLDVDRIKYELGEEVGDIADLANRTRDELRESKEEGKKLSQKLDELQEKDKADKEAKNLADLKEQWRRDIQAVHPDAFDLAETQGFQGWLTTQVPLIQGYYESGNQEQVIHMFDIYKRDVADSDKQPQQQQQEGQLLDEARQAAEPDVSTITTDPSSNTTPVITQENLAAMRNGTPEEIIANNASLEVLEKKGVSFAW